MSSRYGWETTGARGWEALEDGAKGLRMNTAQALQQKQDQRAARKAAADGVGNAPDAKKDAAALKALAKKLAKMKK